MSGSRSCPRPTTQLVDGISGVDIATVLLDTSSNPAPVAPPAQEWIPRPLPSDAQLLADALMERVTVPTEFARGVRAALRGPQRLAGPLAPTALRLAALASGARSRHAISAAGARHAI